MKIAVIMGSASDYKIMKDVTIILDEFKVEYEVKVVSAHRTPKMMFDFADNAILDGYKVIIAGAGGAAHLPGMVAAITTLPVIGVPISLKNLEGIDSLLSIVQMPKGVPVATVGINQAANAALLAISILALNNQNIADKLTNYKTSLEDKIMKMELE